MINYFNGKLGLGKTYWLGVFGVGILARLVFQGINYGYFSAATNDQLFDTLEIVQVGLAIAYAIYLTLMIRALFKAGHDDRTPGFWGWTGMAVTTIAAGYTWYVAAALINPSITTPLSMVKIEIREINKQLPQQIEPDLTLEKVELAGRDMTYIYRAAYSVSDIDQAQVENFLSINGPDGQDLCRDIQGYFKGGVTGLVYVFRYTDHNLITRLPAEDCLAWISAGGN